MKVLVEAVDLFHGFFFGRKYLFGLIFCLTNKKRSISQTSSDLPQVCVQELSTLSVFEKKKIVDEKDAKKGKFTEGDRQHPNENDVKLTPQVYSPPSQSLVMDDSKAALQDSSEEKSAYAKETSEPVTPRTTTDIEDDLEKKAGEVLVLDIKGAQIKENKTRFTLNIKGMFSSTCMSFSRSQENSREPYSKEKNIIDRNDIGTSKVAGV